MAEKNEAVNTSDLKEEDAKSIKKYDREILLMLRESPLALTRPDLPYDRGFVVGEHSWGGSRKTLPVLPPANFHTGDAIGLDRGVPPLFSLLRWGLAEPVHQPRCESHVVTPSRSSKLSVNAATAKDKPSKSLSVGTNIALHASRIPSEEETSESSNCAKTIIDSSSTAAQTDKMKATSQDLIALVQSILNNLMSGNVNTLATEIRELPIANIVELQQVLDMIFRKAVEDPGLSQACATMCKVLTGMQVPAEQETCEVPEFVNIRAFLVNRCQAEFGKYKAFWLSRELVFGEISGMQNDKQKADILSVYMMIEKKVQTTFFTIIGFYGVLFNDRLLTTNLMHQCIYHLLLSDVEGSMECLCQLLTTVGKTLESKSGVLGNANDLTEYFTRMADILQQSEGVSPALRRTIQDLIDLRKRNWVPREDSANSQSGVQLHERSEEAQTNASGAKRTELGSSPRLNEPSLTSVSGHDSRMDSTAADVQMKSSQDDCALASTNSKDVAACAEKVGGTCIDSNVAGSSGSEVPQERMHVSEGELGLGAPQVPTLVETVAAGTSHSDPVHKNVDTPEKGPTPRMTGHRGPMVSMPSNHVGQQMFSQPVQMQSMPQMYASQVAPAQLQQQMFVPQGHMSMVQNQPRHQNHANAAYYTQPGLQQILMTKHPLFATAGYPQQHAPAQPCGPPVVVGSQPSGPQGPPSLSRASSGVRRKFALHILDPKTMKSISSEFYEEGLSLPGLPPGSQDSSARQTPQPQSVTNASAMDIKAIFAARTARVASQGAAAPASRQFPVASTPSPGPQSSQGQPRLQNHTNIVSLTQPVQQEQHAPTQPCGPPVVVGSQPSGPQGPPSVSRASSGVRRKFALDLVDPKTMKSISSEICVGGSSLPGSSPGSLDSSAGQTPQPQSDFTTRIEELLFTATAGSVPGLLSQIQELPINSNEIMKQAFNLVFAKAEVCSSARETLAEMLCVMSQLPPPQVAVAGHQTIGFRLQLQLLIVNRCLDWFEKNTKRALARDAKLKKIIVNSDPVLKNKLYALCMEEERGIRLEFVGFVEFAVFLYRRQLVSAKMMHRCIRHLLSSGDSVSLLCLCRLLRSIGGDLDKAALPGTPHATSIELSEYLNRLKAIASEKSESSELRAEILDVLQLRRNKWLPTLNPAQ